MKVRLAKSSVAAGLLILAPACSNSSEESVAAAPRTRASLFEFMPDARFEGLPEAGATSGETRTTSLTFDAAPEAIWFATPSGRRLEYVDDPGEYVHFEEGRSGNALTLGPAEVEDTARALLVVPAAPLARVTVTGRVRNDGNPKSGDASQAKMEEMYAAFTAWREKFKDNIVDMGGKLGGGAHVTEGGVSDGPFVEAKEVVGGFMILSADTLEQAVEIARGIPGVISAHSSLELREIQTP